MSDRSARVISHYERHDYIGEGASAIVFRGVDSHTGKPVAIKQLKSQKTPASARLERFWREGELLRAMDHPNIVKLLDIVSHHDQHFLIMDYVPGGSLRDVLNQAIQLPLGRTLWIALDLADALTRAHRLDIVHRDLKPENVLLASDGTPRLTDFGIAYLAGSDLHTQEGALIGTPHYLSPEAINGQQADARADLWSFGVLLYEMLAGHVPFRADLMTQLFYAILHDPVPDLEVIRPDAPIALVDLIYRMLEKDPRARMPSVRLVGAELEALLHTENLVEHVLGEDADRYTYRGSSVFATPTPTTGAPQHNLPMQTTPFVGREDELAEIARLLRDPETRLVTILGPGGMGKTRLVLEAAEQQVGTFERGVWFVPLAALSDPAHIVSAIAKGVGLQFYENGGSQREQLMNYLRAKSLLLVLDNFEHLLEGADLVHEILSTAPGVKVLVTSRAKLNLGAEVLLAISGVEFPDWETPQDALEYAAVKLFVQSARRVAPSFALGIDHLRYVARICRLVVGMPLGIVLAASWIDMFSPHEIADEIARSLDFLETERRDLPDRHRSIRAVFDSAWGRLSADERDAFMRLAVFRGGFTRRAAQTVTGASLRLLSGLANKSLLRRLPESGRYEVHELLRQYAEEQLEQAGQADSVRDAHATYYLDALAAFAPDILSEREMEVIRAIGIDMENVRAAWLWALEHGDFAAIARARQCLWQFLDRESRRQEGKALFRAAVQALDTDVPEGDTGILLGQMLHILQTFVESMPEQLALAQRSYDVLTRLGDAHHAAYPLLALAGHAYMSGDVMEARRMNQQAITTFRSHDDRFGLMWALQQCGWRLGVFEGDVDTAEPYIQEALRLAQTMGSPSMIAQRLIALAVFAHARGEHTQGQRHNLAAMAHFEAVNHRVGQANVLNNMGAQAYQAGDYQQAAQLSEQSLTLGIELGATFLSFIARMNLSLIALAQDDQDRARHHLHTCLLTLAELSWFWGDALAVIGCAAMLIAQQGCTTRAAELLALVLSSDERIQERLRMRFEALHDDLHAQLPPDVFAAAWARGAGLDIESTVRALIDDLSAPSDPNH